ncbi:MULTISPECIES: GntR family transcriptional regulator [Bacillus]|jgi:GntR family transcriptional regulator, transcriptional regulator of bglA|uniref:GntR family transcriptional regulator n=1 Tax=Bacillus cereus TaxID=1396 RepID=A0A9X6XWM7_BACCE|nr:MULTISPECIES: GntR family transcriptional regulator [Bacillus]ANN33548.1 GntR family transcriptional regulator [Bacillus thuringiensis serovar coreanensis]NIE92213.1 GntR family transcriptional regulator [Bacillus sp. Ab-1751]WIL45939.1 GntR family transcriptional regulator [Bacillus bombysepticus]HCX51981.1 GntR family transcriptional regulator [Bacillus sp. (in: firmicutes)]ANV70885.1 GntR family transcriptional regulator [Bacillus thuringiensis]
MSAKYKQIADVLEQNIRDGLFNETKKLPTEEALMNRFEVSRNTIRKVISQLVNRGYIFQVQGSGMFLRETSVTDYINLGSLRGLTKNLVSQNIETKVLELEVIDADEEIAKQMQCEAGTRLYFLKRLRIVDAKPFSIEVSYFKKDIIPYLNEEIALSSVYSYFIEDLRLNIGFADKVISCEKVNKENAQLLELNEGDPALLIENTVYLVNGTIFELSQSMFHYEKAKLLNRINFK